MDKNQFFREGFYTEVGLLNPAEVALYLEVYDQLLTETLNRPDLRSDLSGEKNPIGEERITQIMRPSLLAPRLLEMPLHQRLWQLVKDLLGTDMALDFDMLINKLPFSNSATPWHQDEAYWIKMPDKRAVSCWVALDESTVDNGAMWYVSQSHEAPLRNHTQPKEGGPLVCEANESEAVCIPLMPGDCTFHHGRTIHFSRGNTTASNRRAFILNFRPEEMIRYERAKGFDHLGKRKDRSV